MKSTRLWTILIAFAVVAALATTAVHGRGGGPLPRPEIFVYGQGLVYDSIVTADPLPPKGPFQLLEEDGPTGLQTEFGPGDPEYVGGRWKMWAPDHPNAEPDGYRYFSCPLLGPGRPVE